MRDVLHRVVVGTRLGCWLGIHSPTGRTKCYCKGERSDHPTKGQKRS